MAHACAGTCGVRHAGDTAAGWRGRVPPMEIFPESYLPGVGMGSVASVVGLGGLIALAVTSGAMLAQGMIGALVFVAAAVAVLLQKHGLLTDPMSGDETQQALVIGVLSFVLVLALVRLAI